MTDPVTLEGRPSRRPTLVVVYIGSVAFVGMLLLALGMRTSALPLGSDLVVFVALAVGVVLVGDVVIEGRARQSIDTIVVLAGQALLGPVGGGLLGLLLAAFQNRGIPTRARVFNLGQNACFGTIAGFAFLLAGGSVDPADSTDVAGVLRYLAGPLLVADVVLVLVNLLLLAGVIRASTGAPLRGQFTQLVTSIGVISAGYGLIAFLLLVLWVPAGLGPVAILLVLAPLLVAQWAYRQYSEELRGQARTLDVLVAALEAKAPHLAGHSDRVATLSERMAASLGVGPQGVLDARLAGRLHDIGQTAVPTGVVRRADLHDPGLADYPGRGARLLTDLDFLEGALAPIAQHRDALDGLGSHDALLARVVGLADAYDLLTEVGAPDGRRLTAPEALEVLRSRPGVDPPLADALRAATARLEVRSGT